MTSSEIRRKYLDFFKARGHIVIPSAPLVPENDPTTLFTSSGMQPLIPYLLGQPHPLGKRLVNSQKSFRAQDIDEVGNRSHTTFFEMLGNWSLGDYFKQEQLPWFLEFLTKELGLAQERLYISLFAGTREIPRDNESFTIWKSLGISENKIFFYGTKENWWSRSGEPDKMPAGEPGGPDSEVFFDFGADLKLHENSSFRKDKCHPNCQCGRFMEIGNSVFMQYQKTSKTDTDQLTELKQKNVDFGGGLERINAAVNDTPDIFTTDSFCSLIRIIEQLSKKTYGQDSETDRGMRIMADHLRGAVMMITEGVIPANKTQGYLLRRLIRRAVLYGKKLGLWGDWQYLDEIVSATAQLYPTVYPEVASRQRETQGILREEAGRFGKTVENGLREIAKLQKLDGKQAFFLYETYGFPWELTEEIARGRGLKVDRIQFKEEFKKHQELSRTATAGMFKGGLADESEQTTKLHTATHLLHAALRRVLGEHVQQKGSNITAERLRFDFSHPKKLTPEQLKTTEDLINQKIKENLPVSLEILAKDQALKSEALAVFAERYGAKVKIYTIGGDSSAPPFSREICGGPHVSFTGTLGHLTIKKEESAGAGVRRIYATVS